MEIVLYQNTSEKNKINKSLIEVETLTGTLRESTNLINPVIRIEYDDPTAFNYCYIREFGRYYFVDNIEIMRTNLLSLSLSVDVLESFKSEILSQKAIIEKSTNINSDYLPDENLKTLVKTKTDIINFSNGFLDSGEFILITAGG